MIAALLFAAQFPIPQALIPPPGEMTCNAEATACFVRYADAAGMILENQALKTQLEGQEEQLGTLRLRIDALEAQLRRKCTAKLEVLPPGGKT